VEGCEEGYEEGYEEGCEEDRGSMVRVLRAQACDVDSVSEFHSDSGDSPIPTVAASAGRASTSHSNHYQIRKLEGGKALTRHLTRLPTILAKCEERCHTLGLNQAILDQIRKEKTSTEIHCDATDR
jgi:hypothetical protein